MLEKKVDILSEKLWKKVNAICFTSNGVTKADGTLVMGAGVAKAFRDRFTWLPLSAGRLVRSYGNKCQIMGSATSEDHIISVVAFPTKQNWRDPSDLSLIVKSSKELIALIEKQHWKQVALPRPGCQNGGLQWETVKEAIEDILDERVLVVHQ
jgi:O-acetyl-ADP-ribose deacetylase (regulator of RNase III)